MYTHTVHTRCAKKQLKQPDASKTTTAKKKKISYLQKDRKSGFHFFDMKKEQGI